MNKSTEQALSKTIEHMMRIYFGGRTYLGDGQYAVTERASQAGEALEAYAKSHRELVHELARQHWVQSERLTRSEGWAWKNPFWSNQP